MSISATTVVDHDCCSSHPVWCHAFSQLPSLDSSGSACNASLGSHVYVSCLPQGMRGQLSTTHLGGLPYGMRGHRAKPAQGARGRFAVS
eukprot:4613037-Alexandrium_andersonii.AAC.1